MAKQTLNTIKNWFKTSLKPTQAQFWDTWDSFWHKDEKIPISSVEQLDTILMEKASTEYVDNKMTVERYSSNVPTTIQLGGFDLASTFTEKSNAEMWYQLTHPYESPVLGGFGIPGQSLLVEVGVTITGSKTFTWTKTNPANIKPNSGIIRETTGNELLLSDIDLLLGTRDLYITVPNTVPGIKSYQLEGVNTNNKTFKSNIITIERTLPVFYGKVNSPGATPARPTAAQGLLAGATKAIIQSNGDITITFNSLSDDYLWFAAPATSPVYTKWLVTVLNSGNIGGTVSPGGNLFPDPDALNLTSPDALWSNVPYRIYITNFRTSVVSITLKTA